MTSAGSKTPTEPMSSSPKRPPHSRPVSQEIVGTTKQNALYSVIMTPVVLVSFLLSLAFVDFRYTLRRSHTHSDEDPTRMPRWLHHLLYRPQPYRYVKVQDEREGVVKTADGEKYYYHSKQKRLLRMEAEDAFQMRWIVVAFLGGFAACCTWGTYVVGYWAWHSFEKWRA